MKITTLEEITKLFDKNDWYEIGFTTPMYDMNPFMVVSRSLDRPIITTCNPCTLNGHTCVTIDNLIIPVREFIVISKPRVIYPQTYPKIHGLGQFRNACFPYYRNMHTTSLCVTFRVQTSTSTVIMGTQSRFPVVITDKDRDAIRQYVEEWRITHNEEGGQNEHE